METVFAWESQIKFYGYNLKFSDRDLKIGLKKKMSFRLLVELRRPSEIEKRMPENEDKVDIW